ncbi:uncharacterized protein LOC128390543 [Panonychus citri]|uniref:uncharacterized protein LOC128390543 n=1 Tax=Panonychus citri TaxID=50023 RepID=UPI0023081652|nr:uncharacterized protein LOC128390543 [Panonychus citri]
MDKNREIQLISYIIMFWFVLYGQVNSLDCRRHVFAPGCRGIVAKRTHNVKFDTQTSKSISPDTIQSSSSSSTSSLLSPLSDEDLIDPERSESIQLKRFNLPLIFMLNRGGNKPSAISPDFNNNNPMGWLFSLTSTNNNNGNSIPLTPIMDSDHHNERQSADNFD